MSIAYCIASHGDPEAATRLINTVLADDPAATVLWHHDPRGEEIDRRLVLGWERITMVAPRPVHWGCFQQVEVFVDCLREVLSQPGVEYAVLMSGQDYPTRHVGDLEAELSRYDVWTDAQRLADIDRSWLAHMRCAYQWRCFPEPKFRHQALWAVSRAFIPYADTFARPRFVRMSQRGQRWWGVRRPLPEVELYGGSSWMSLSRNAARAVVDSADRDEALWRFFSRIPSADECCFHTVLHAADGLSFAPDHGRYIRFPGPKVVELEDLDEIRESGADFVRKVEPRTSASLMAALDTIAGRAPHSDAKSPDPTQSISPSAPGGAK